MRSLVSLYQICFSSGDLKVKVYFCESAVVNSKAEFPSFAPTRGDSISSFILMMVDLAVFSADSFNQSILEDIPRGEEKSILDKSYLEQPWG